LQIALNPLCHKALNETDYNTLWKSGQKKVENYTFGKDKANNEKARKLREPWLNGRLEQREERNKLPDFIRNAHGLHRGIHKSVD